VCVCVCVFVLGDHVGVCAYLDHVGVRVRVCLFWLIMCMCVCFDHVGVRVRVCLFWVIMCVCVYLDHVGVRVRVCFMGDHVYVFASLLRCCSWWSGAWIMCVCACVS